MKFRRREFLHLAAGAAVWPALPRNALGQAYPTRPPHIVSGFPPGGISDTYARLIAHWLSERIGQQFIVENRPGAGGNIGAESVARAAPDGYTLLLTTSADAWNTTLYPNNKFNLVRDLAPVAPVARGAGLRRTPVGPGEVGPRTDRRRQGQSRQAHHGLGRGRQRAAHVLGAVPQRDRGQHGARALPRRRPGGERPDRWAGADLLRHHGFGAGQRQSRQAQGPGGDLDGALAGAADVPAMAEFLPGYEASIFVGISAPHGTPADVLDRLNREISAAGADATFRQRIADLGDAPLTMSVAEFSKLATDETGKWAKVIRSGNIRAE